MSFGSSPSQQVKRKEKKRWEYKATKPKRAKTYDKAKLVKTMQLNLSTLINHTQREQRLQKYH